MNRKHALKTVASILVLVALLVAPSGTLVRATPPIEGNTVEFADSGQSLGSANSARAVLGDLDGDGDLDAFVGNNGANTVWMNDGSGTFTDSSQSLGTSDSQNVALGDLDSDGDLDAFVANYQSTNRVWINDGSGACESQNSPYRDWFRFTDVTPGTGTCVGSDGTPNAATYSSWWGYDSLPTMESSNEDVRDYFYDDGASAIGPYWVQWADGWREGGP